MTAKSNDTWEESERHRLSPYGRTLPDEPEESNGGRGYLWAGLAITATVLIVSLVLVLLAEGWRP